MRGGNTKARPHAYFWGIYCLTCTVVFTNIALQLSNHLYCVCTLDGLNAEHKFRVWVTILGHMSRHVSSSKYCLK